MNANLHDDYNEPDYEAAHFAAFHKMPDYDRDTGQLNCTDYLIEYHSELSEAPPPVTRELLATLDSMPKLGRNTAEAQLVADAFSKSHLEVPEGLHELPVSWGYAIRKVIFETHWPSYTNCRIRDVFGWTYVNRFGAHLHIHFENPLPAKTPWCDVGQLIHELHYVMEPGPYTPAGRLCEFSLD